MIPMEPYDGAQAQLADLVIDEIYGPDGLDIHEVAEKHKVTVAALQAACGRSETGHDFQDFDQGDATTPYYQSWRCCVWCGAEDNGGDE